MTTSPTRSSTASSNEDASYVSTAPRFVPSTSPPTSSPEGITMTPEAAEFPERTAREHEFLCEILKFEPPLERAK